MVLPGKIESCMSGKMMEFRHEMRRQRISAEMKEKWLAKYRRVP
jgi:uncharacterized membrane protein